MLFYLMVFLLGSVIGSFLNVCIYRIPRAKSIVFPSSRCPSCSNPIQIRDNIPILSYILLRGKCRYCKTGISPRYPLVEMMNGLCYIALLWRYGFGVDYAVYCVFLSSLIVITFIDLDFQIIPDRISLPGIPIGLLTGSFVLPDPFLRAAPLGFIASLVGSLSGFSFYFLVMYLSLKILGKEGMGGGDVKLMTMVGAFLGWKAVILTTFLGSLSGSVIGVMLMLIKGRSRGSLIPFGPFLAFGATISIFFGQEILLWYLY